MTHVWTSLSVVVRSSWGLREIIRPQGHRGQQGSSTLPKASVYPPYIFLVLSNDQGAVQTIQPSFLILPRLELGPPCPIPFWELLGFVTSFQFYYPSSFSQVRFCPFMLYFWLVLCTSKSRNTSPCTTFISRAQVREFHSSGFSCMRAWQGNFPLFFP